jgi:hypothetical protein
LAFGLLAWFISPAAALTIDFNEQSAACQSGLGCNNSGTLVAQAVVSNIAGGVSIDITLKDLAFDFFEAGNPPMVAFQPTPTNAIGAALAGVTAAMNELGCSGATQCNTWSVTGSGLNGALALADGVGYDPNHNNPFQFDITFDLSGLTTASFTADANGYLMAVDMLNGTGNTGFIGGILHPPGSGQGEATPLPGTLALFVGGLGMLGLVSQRRKRKGMAFAA